MQSIHVIYKELNTQECTKIYSTFSFYDLLLKLPAIGAGPIPTAMLV